MQNLMLRTSLSVESSQRRLEQSQVVLAQSARDLRQLREGLDRPVEQGMLGGVSTGANVGVAEPWEPETDLTSV